MEGTAGLLLISSVLFAIQYLGSLYLVKKMLQEERSGHVTYWEMWESSTLSPFYLEIALLRVAGYSSGNFQALLRYDASVSCVFFGIMIYQSQF